MRISYVRKESRLSLSDLQAQVPVPANHLLPMHMMLRTLRVTTRNSVRQAMLV